MPKQQPTVPRLFGRHVFRPRLTALLDETSAQAIVLLAPAGYGKTSLACEWLRERPDVAWYRATSGAADVAAFSLGIAEALEHVLPGCSTRLRQRLSVGDAPENLARSLADILATDLFSWPAGAILVVDDYHLVAESQAVEEFTDRLLQACPPLHMLVTTRHRPSWLSARRVLHGEALEVGIRQLAMTATEAAALLQHYPADVASELARRAQGWPALLALAALASSVQSPFARLSVQLYRYFAEEVLANETPAIRDFLFQTSLASRVTPEFCERVLDITDPHPLIVSCLERNLLQETVDGYALHPLLRQFLRDQFVTDSQESISLLKRYIAYALERGYWEDAFEAAELSGDSDQMLSTLVQAGESLLASGKVETVRKWIAQIRRLKSREPLLDLFEAELFYRANRLGEARTKALHAAALLPSFSDHCSRAWYVAGHCAYMQGASKQSFQDFLQAHRQAQTARHAADAISGLLWASIDLEGDASEYNELLQRLDSTDETVWARRLIGATMLLQSEGRPREALTLIHANRSRCLALSNPAFRTNIEYQLMHCHLLLGRYKQVCQLAARVQEECSAFHLEFALPLCIFVEAVARVSSGDVQRASRLASCLRSHAEHSEDPFLAAAVAIVETRLHLAGQRYDAAFACACHVASGPIQPVVRAELLALAGLASILAGERARASVYLRRALRVTRNPTIRTLARLSGLVANPPLADITRSPGTLVGDITQRGLAHPFLSVVRVAPQVLSALAANPALRPAVYSLLYGLRDESLLRIAGFTTGILGDNTYPRLTRREREVFELMSSGLSNREIANILVIAESTAKVHVRHILRKLGVRNRLQAVLVAQSGAQP